MEYTLAFSHGSWTCGDGCCSEEWYDVELFKGNELITQWDRIDMYLIGCYEPDVEWALNWANEALKQNGLDIVLTPDNCKID